jgi:hypothetical protein
MARNGKIARLPLHIRTQLNQRLSEGESGVKLVEWLNDEAMLSLKKDAEGKRILITEQNLSEWRSGGYQDWLRHEEARQFTEDLAEQAGELDKAADGKSICDRFGALLAVDMARLAKKFLQQETDDEKRWERLKEISKELSRLRRDEHRAVWTWIKREQWERRREREDYEEEETIRKEVRHEGIAPLLALRRVRNLGNLYGGGPDGMETAAMVLEVQEDLEPGSLVDTVRAYNADQAVRAGRATEVLSSKPVAKDEGRTAKGDKPQCGGQSIKPNPTKSNLPSLKTTARQAKSNQSEPDGLPAKKAERRMHSAEAAGELSADDADSRRGGEIDRTKSDRIQPNPTSPSRTGQRISEREDLTQSRGGAGSKTKSESQIQESMSANG